MQRVGRRQQITVRAVLIGLLLIPINAWWLAQIEYVRYSDNVTTSALFFNCIAVLLLCLALNALLKRLVPRWALSRGEILTLYIMLVVASALGGHDQLQILFTTITWVFRNATFENGWAEELHPHIPEHLTVSDPQVLEGLYLGDTSIYRPDVLTAWVRPLGWWTLFGCALVWTLYCFTSIFRKQWDRERLSYPITLPPLEITERDNSVLPSPLFWAAFALAAAVQSIRLAHNIWPAFPNLNIGVHAFAFTGLPLSAAGDIPISSYPFSYGMAYLLPVQIAFSVWFFFFFVRLQMVIAAMFGHTRWGGFPYIQEQGAGAFIGVAAFVLWAARGHLRRIWHSALGGAGYDDEGEPVPGPVAVWGFLLGVAVLVGFSMTAGMSALAGVSFFAVFLTITLTLTRLRAELGLPTIGLFQAGADDILQNTAGGAAWSARDLTVMSLYFWLVRTHRQLPMPIHADCLRIGDEAGLDLRRLSPVILGASAFGIVAAFWALLHVTYQTGYETAKFTGPAGWAFGSDPWRKLDAWLTNPRPPQHGAVGAYGYGIAFTLFLAAMRTRFLWWPFHPVGYLVSGSLGLFRLWLPIFLTWLIKSLLLRYGGLPAYHRARPFFFGLIFGEFAAAFLRTVLDLAFELRLPATSGVGGL